MHTFASTGKVFQAHSRRHHGRGRRFLSQRKLPLEMGA